MSNYNQFIKRIRELDMIQEYGVEGLTEEQARRILHNPVIKRAWQEDQEDLRRLIS